MNSALATLIVVQLLQAAAPATFLEECRFWKDIVGTRGFMDVVLEVTNGSYLDIKLPPKYGGEGVRLLTDFLKVLPTSQRIFREIGDVCDDCSTRRNRHVELRLLCKASNRRFVDLDPHPYFRSLRVVADDIGETGLGSMYKVLGGRNQFGKLWRGGDYHIFVHDQQTSIIGNDDFWCLNCTTHFRRDISVKLTRDKPLRGIELLVACKEPLICDSPSFRVLVKIMRHDNCTTHIIRFRLMEHHLASEFRTMIDPRFLHYASMAHGHETYFPTTSTLSYFDATGFATFVKALTPLPKEVVLFMPFTGSVWAVFLACSVVTTLINFLVYKVHWGVQSYVEVAAPLAATVLEQGYAAPAAVETAHSFRILFGVWCVAMTVLATGYRAMVTSLLCNVPMDGELQEYVSLLEAKRKGVAMCFVNFPEEELNQYFIKKDRTFKYKWTQSHFGCVDRSKTLRVRPGTDVLFVFRPSADETEQLKDELFFNGFVRSDKDVSPIITGPKFKSSSPYYSSLSKLLSRALEAGLFEQAVRISEYKSRARREFKRGQPPKNEDTALSLGDLRPCFVIWALGIGLSLTVSAARYGATYVLRRQRRGVSRRHTIHQEL